MARGPVAPLADLDAPSASGGDPIQGLNDGEQESKKPDEGAHEPLFALWEYARAEARFIGSAVDALARTRDGLYGQIDREPVTRVQTTQITTDEGVVVEQSSVPVRFHITLHPEDLISGRVDRLIASFDEAAEELLGGVMPQFYDYMSRITEATGNVVDAKDRPFFDSFYEMIEKVEMDFDEEGNHSHVLIVHPDTWRVMQEKARDFTPEQQRKLAALFNRKREEALARRRHRRIP